MHAELFCVRTACRLRIHPSTCDVRALYVNLRIRAHNALPPGIFVLTRKSKTEAVLQRRSMLKLGVICKYMKRYGKCWGWHPLPLAYCVALYFGIAYCVPPLFCLAYCVPFNNKTTILSVSFYIKKLKLQYAVWTCTVILETWVFICFLVKFPKCWPPPIVKSMFKFINVEMSPKSASVASAQFFKRYLTLYAKCVVFVFFKWKLDLFKVKIDVCVRYNRISAYCVPTLCVLRTV